MSRLPRPHSSPDAKTFAPSLKRKVVPEEDDIDEQPAKKGSGFRPKPLQASRSAINATASTSTASTSNGPAKSAVMPRPLTRPRPPVAARPTARGASAPPVSTVRKPSAGLGASRVPASSALTKRTASGAGVPASVAAPDVITHLHKRLTTLESARTQDAERLTTLLESTAASASASASSAPSTGAAEVQAELIIAQLQLAGATGQLNAAHAQVSALQTELGAATRALRAREESEGEARREALALKAEVLAGKTAVASALDDAGELRRALAREREEGEIRVRRGERLLREAKDDVEEREAKIGKLRKELAGAVDAEVGLQERYRALTGRLEGLGGDVAGLLREKAEWEAERAAWEEEKAAMREEAVRGEEERRRLHGMVMELKGNIRVFCRVRPLLPSEGEVDADVGAQIAYPDAGLPYPSGQKEIVLSSTGAEREWDAGMGNKPRKEVWGFGFDRVFTPSSTQADLFAEISQLAQSSVDGYNVCIFAYGQTGSGKSWTMEGGGTEETQGMIPRAVAQVFRVAEELKDKGWTYTMEGQFLEIYNETITDLLAPAPAAGEAPRKHEIHHHPTTHLTTVSDALTPPLTSPAQVLALLAQAQGRRRVAATLMNERSSRSHSVFTLRVRGAHASGEGARLGTLNLVDLAGSERLATLGLGGSVGGAGGERLKETQSINRSLSALGDVVAALGSGAGAHVPYRNSKLTYLLQNSLSGNSKTLMVLNLSPLAAHLNESLTSLRFATKVNNTTIGTAKKVQVQGAK
ncbi:P-loop containing nucleoside triphosphate hydrolase protein [Mycena rosella]|uniref:Kinesin-like protein n=1 Tax=Mycena rosella TaxID=1033263 RepID=A0AAD7DCD7_MYCRO|nr:P-loop containing nucleoside triphosphate hydrolase protein [Mycena rosella]